MLCVRGREKCLLQVPQAIESHPSNAELETVLCSSLSHCGMTMLRHRGGGTLRH